MPIADVTTDAVADGAGVTKKTLYYHFPTKARLVEACFEHRVLLIVEQYESWFSNLNKFEDKFAIALGKMREFALTENCHNCAFIKHACDNIKKSDDDTVKIIKNYKKSHEIFLENYEKTRTIVNRTGCLVNWQ